MIRNIKNCLHRLRYITEFICASIFIFFLMQTIYIKVYGGYFHKLYLLGSIIWFIILLINIIYNIIKSNKKIENIFLNFAIPIGLFFLLFMIPGHVPDENAHFYKAYDVSYGNLVTKVNENGESYIDVPKDLVNYDNSIKNYNELEELYSKKTDYKDTQKVISTAQGNSFIAYIFSAIAFLIARFLNMPIFYGILLGRLFNLSFYIFMIYLALKKIPFGKKVLAVYSLMPMCMQQASSFSPDAVINGVLLYYIAHEIFLIFKEEKITFKEWLIYIILTPIICLIKMVYILVAGVGFLIIKRKDLTKKNKILIIAITIILGSVTLLGMYIFSPKYEMTAEFSKEYLEKTNVHPTEQVQTIINNPIHILNAFTFDYYNMGNYYINSAIGDDLGWLEINPPEILITSYLILILFSILLEKHNYEFNLKNKLWIFSIVIGIITLVQLALYVNFTPVGGEFIGGIQGRYYIPVFILLLLCFCSKKYNFDIKNSDIKLISIAGILDILVIWH